MVDMRDVKRKYRAHKAHAAQRGVEFKMTFDEWWGIWKPHWHNRGRGKGQFVMCRTMDKGAYEIGNVRIDTPAGNARTRAYVNYDRKMDVVKAHYTPKDAPSEDYTDSQFEEDWLPRHLRGYSPNFVWD